MLTGGTFQKEQEGTSLPGATDPPCPQAQGCSVCRRMLGHPLIVVPWGSTRGCLRPRTCGTLTGPPSNHLGNQTRKGPAASMLPGQWFSGHCDWTRAPGSSWEACGSKGTRQSLGRPGYAVQARCDHGTRQISGQEECQTSWEGQCTVARLSEANSTASLRVVPALRSCGHSARAHGHVGPRAGSALCCHRPESLHACSTRGLLPGKLVSFCFCRTVTFDIRRKHSFCIKAKLPITASCKRGGRPQLSLRSPTDTPPPPRGTGGWGRVEETNL